MALSPGLGDRYPINPRTIVYGRRQRQRVPKCARSSRPPDAGCGRGTRASSPTKQIVISWLQLSFSRGRPRPLRLASNRGDRPAPERSGESQPSLIDQPVLSAIVASIFISRRVARSSYSRLPVPNILGDRSPRRSSFQTPVSRASQSSPADTVLTTTPDRSEVNWCE